MSTSESGSGDSRSAPHGLEVLARAKTGSDVRAERRARDREVAREAAREALETRLADVEDAAATLRCTLTTGEVRTPEAASETWSIVDIVTGVLTAVAIAALGGSTPMAAVAIGLVCGALLRVVHVGSRLLVRYARVRARYLVVGVASLAAVATGAVGLAGWFTTGGIGVALALTFAAGALASSLRAWRWARDMNELLADRLELQRAEAMAETLRARLSAGREETSW